jgi:CRISPR-associated protein Cmr2
MTQQAIVLFAVGPVQDFIANARTARDLWAGSRLICYLSETAQDYFIQQNPTLAFPIYPGFTPPTDRNLLSPEFPNKFSVRLEVNSLDEAAQIAGRAQAKVIEEWLEIAGQVKSQLDNLIDPLAWPQWDKGWAEQISDFVEVYWACTLVGGGEENESKSKMVAHQQVAAGLDARKRLRDFKSYSGDWREKDTIDGLFERMGPAGTTPASRSVARAFWASLLENVTTSRGPAGRPIARLARNEALSAINLIKRFAWDYSFRPRLRGTGATLPMVSTADVAISGWRTRLKTLYLQYPPLKEALDSYLKNDLAPYLQEIDEPGNYVRLEDIDGRYFYPEIFELQPESELSRAYEEHEDLTPDSTGKDQTPNRLKAQAGLVRFLRFLKEQFGVLGMPPRYFAVLKLDGDKMGELISRQSDPLVISRSLAGFAREIRHIVQEEFSGKVIYTGGDDALVLLPNENLFACASKLRESFPLLAGKAALDMQTTISMGAAIAHYKYPLQKTLAAARQAEKQAKQVYNRDALALQVLKRSGEVLHSGSHWRENNGQMKVFEELNNLKEALRLGHLSPRLAYELRRETFTLAKTSETRLITPLVKEFERLFKRHSAGPKELLALVKKERAATGLPEDTAAQDARVGELMAGLDQLKVTLATLAHQVSPGEPGQIGFENFSNLLLITEFVAREWEEH